MLAPHWYNWCKSLRPRKGKTLQRSYDGDLILVYLLSLQELHLVLDCSLAQIYRLAAHLIYWRKAKLIHTIHARNIYVVSPQAKLQE